MDSQVFGIKSNQKTPANLYIEFKKDGHESYHKKY